MKRSLFSNLLVLSLVLMVGGAGCKSPKKGLTLIPGTRAQVPGGGGPSGPMPVSPGPASVPETGPTGTDINKTPTTTSGIATTPLEEIDNMIKRPEILKEDSVYFDFDRSEVKSGERSKVEAVATYLKDNTTDKLLIEGNCDERGTEEYNRALGERRALALREYLVNLGVSADRMRTLSWGKDKPVDPGHNEAAWAKNRRGDFVVLKPKP